MSFRHFAASAALLAVALLAGVGASPADAQYGPGAGGRAPYARGGANEAGRFDYYALSLSWSPTYCASAQSGRDDQQCNSRDGKRYSFVLHGLWPQYEKGWPQNCPTSQRAYVPQRTINGMLDIMPSPKLVIHEYRTHGTCSGLSPEDYFATARRYYQKVKIPQRFYRPNQAFTIGTEEVVREFVEANPGLKAESVAVVCSGGRGDRLREVRVCVSREGEFRACGANEEPKRLCRSNRVYVPPVRGGEGSQSGPGGRDERRI
ncbi:MAG: ribonuclease T2 [Proteobacteria bacterium]|nr:ribonuclease T2 [Pseudomonadota bacterium]